MVNFLRQFAEEVPQWLMNYKQGDFVSFSNFMSGRVGYYPGSGDDGNLVSVANSSHCVHAYLYVDYFLSRNEIIDCLQRYGFKGYHPIGTVEWAEKDITPHGQHPFDVDYRIGCRGTGPMNKEEKPFCFLEIFERDATLHDDWGAERFAVAFLFADAIATYHQVFCKEYRKAPWIMLLQDHGFGGNYDRFGKGGLMEAIMKKNGIFPEFVICAANTHIWDGYSEVWNARPTFGGMHNSKRHLFVNSSMIKNGTLHFPRSARFHDSEI